MADRFEHIYSDVERDAIGHAFADGGIRPARRVVELAQLGQLEAPDGTVLAPFTVPESSVRAFARRWRRRAQRDAAERVESGSLTELEPRDAVEALRLQLLEVAEREMRHVRKQKAGEVDAESLRKLARVVRELQAIPGRDEPRMPRPGQKVNGVRYGSEVRSGIAADLLAAHRASRDDTTPVWEPPPVPAPPETSHVEAPRSDAATTGAGIAAAIRAQLEPHVRAEQRDDAPRPRDAPTLMSPSHVVDAYESGTAEAHTTDDAD